jgi:HEAT repeat protein
MKSDEIDRMTTEALLEKALAVSRADPTDETDERWDLIRALHRRADRTILERALAWCAGAEAVERVLGADVLAQLGTASEAGVRLYAAESTPVLCGLLRDTDERVLRSALFGLGHLETGEPAEVATLATHSSADVRHAVAHALGGRSDPVSIRTLVALTADADGDVRDWATFALGSLCEIDTPEVRESLLARVADSNSEARGEALVGLAVRADRRAAPHIVAALKGGATDYLTLDAARELLERCPEETELRRLLEART